jgi:hypothetical protein
MNQRTRFLGLDVHKETIAVAIAEEGSELQLHSTIANRPEAVRKLVREVGSQGVQLVAAYEAGPTGYAVHRQLVQLGVDSIRGRASQRALDRRRPGRAPRAVPIGQGQPKSQAVPARRRPQPPARARGLVQRGEFARGAVGTARRAPAAGRSRPDLFGQRGCVQRRGAGPHLRGPGYPPHPQQALLPPGSGQAGAPQPRHPGTLPARCRVCRD